MARDKSGPGGGGATYVTRASYGDSQSLNRKIRLESLVALVICRADDCRLMLVGEVLVDGVAHLEKCVLQHGPSSGWRRAMPALIHVQTP
jgi:hypothetical protein